MTIAALGAKTFSSVSGLRMTATCFLSSLRHMDTLLIPRGRGIRLSSSAPKLADWISRRANGIRRIASVCTGAFAIAPTGLLDGRRVTTHWKFAAELASRFPALKVDADALYIRAGKFYTSAGVTAGIDLSLALIEEDFGPRVALAVARELVVYMKRPGGARAVLRAAKVSGCFHQPLRRAGGMDAGTPQQRSLRRSHGRAYESLPAAVFPPLQIGVQ